MNGNFDNTYKIAWAKSLVELSSSINISDDGPIIFSFEQIVNFCFKYYGQRGLSPLAVKLRMFTSVIRMAINR